MKKYISVFFVFAFILSMFVFNVNLVSAAGPYTPGCDSTVGYSPLTGEKCAIVDYSSLPAGCTSTLGYSPLTGVKCDSPTSNPALPDGCTSTLGYSPLTGTKCDSGVISTPVYPPGCTSNSGYSVMTGQSCGGGYSPVPTISGVSGPQSLNVNQQGTWTINAFDPSGGNLSYSVVWGDEWVWVNGTEVPPYRLPAQQSATFTHSYSQSGAYVPTFTVTNTSGQSATISLSVNVGNMVTPNSSITVLSPNGGETWTTGTMQTIRWQDNANISTNEIKMIGLDPYTGARNSYYTIANTQGSSYDWSVGKTLDNIPNNIVVDGSYIIQICQTGTYPNICDESNSYFKIVSGTTTGSPQIISITGNQSNYSSNSEIGLTIQTTDGMGHLASNTSGYNIQAYIFPASDSNFSGNYLTPNPTNSYNGVYDTSSGYWKVNMNAPLNTGSYNLRVVLYCSNPDWGTCNNPTHESVKILPFTVGSASTALSITTSSPLPNAKVGDNYSQNIYADGNVSSWAISGSLPPGLISSSGYCGDGPCQFPETISGIPTTAGTYTFNVIVTSGSQSVTKQFTLTVYPADVTSVSTGELRGKVCKDDNGNGTCDVGEVFFSDPSNQGCASSSSALASSALAGITIAYSGPVSGTTTLNQCSTVSGDPIFSVTGIPVGTYSVRLNAPNGWQVTGSQVASNGAWLSNSNPVNVSIPANNAILFGMKSSTIGMILGAGSLTANAINGITTPPSTSSPACTITNTLKIGSTGDEVSCLQTYLRISSDGKFGPKTKTAVIVFQSNAGLKADGVVGPKSITALRVAI